MTPAPAARTDPIRKVSAITRLTSTPMKPAASASWATARMAFPQRVRRTNWSSPIIKSSAVASSRSWTFVNTAPPAW